MQKLPPRLVVYAQDVCNITGMQPDTARKLLCRIRKKFNKEKRAMITVYEFCEFMGFREEKVAEFLR